MSPTAMRRVPIGRTGLQLSVVGFGTCQLRMVPEQQAVATLVRGFELGVNWVHTAPDYGGAEELLARAIRESGADVVPVSNGYGEMSHFRWLFERTCRIFGRDRLPIWGISCIDDAEFVGCDVWGRDGMVAFLGELKRQGRIGAAFCTTHGPPDYVARLLECGHFDAVMLAWNPLGFHALSYHAKSEGKTYEDLVQNRARVFPLAQQLGKSLLVMKPFAGGLLTPSKAFPPHRRFSREPAPLPAGDILRAILAEPGVTAVCPGTASVAEAEENARAGHEPVALPAPRAAAVAATTADMRRTLCSRCGDCEPTCSRQLPVSWLFREGYVWNYPSDTFEANTRQHYFHLHRDDALACATCTDRTCVCPAGIDIPAELARVHDAMLALRRRELLPAAPADLAARLRRGYLAATLLWHDVPRHAAPDRVVVCTFWLENSGDRWWLREPGAHPGDVVALAVVHGDDVVLQVPVRHDVEPRQRTHFAFELRAPLAAGDHPLRFFLAPVRHADPVSNALLLHGSTLTVADLPDRPPADDGARRARRVAVTPVPGRPARPWTVDWLRETRAPDAYGVRWIEHTVPASADAGAVIGARFTVQNTGSLTWQPATPHGNDVDVGAFVDNGIVATLKLPHAVPAGGEATVLFALRLPSTPGRHVVRFAFVEQKVTVFTDRGVPPLELEVQVAPPAAGDRNGELWDVFARVDPWHYMPTQGISRTADGTRLPVFVARAQGCRIEDAAGREYIDYTMGWGTTLLGYAHPHVVAALRSAIDSGATVALPHAIEMDVARMVHEDIPCAEMVLFGKNGTDACTVAARMARGFTGRRKILYCGYHGFGDWWVEQHGFLRTGVPDRPERLIWNFHFNDLDSFDRLLALHRGDLAMVMLEPSGPWGGNERGFEPDAAPGFLEALAERTRAAGALLVFDEIITGYRYPGHSVQKARGVVPDLACLGKAFASGMPLSAVVGRRDVFERALPNCHYGPTFKGEALSLFAAKATIEVCRREPVARHVWDYGERLRTGVHRLCAAHGVDAAMTGPPFRMSFLFREPDPVRRKRRRTLLQQELLRAGLSTYNGVMLPCLAHDDAALAATLERFGRALAVVAAADRAGDHERRLEIPPLIDL